MAHFTDTQSPNPPHTHTLRGQTHTKHLQSRHKDTKHLSETQAHTLITYSH